MAIMEKAESQVNQEPLVARQVNLIDELSTQNIFVNEFEHGMPQSRAKRKVNSAMGLSRRFFFRAELWIIETAKRVFEYLRKAKVYACMH